jgi:hypothetical protein
VQQLEEDVVRFKEEAARESGIGFKQYLREVWCDLELDEHDGPLASLMRELLETDDDETNRRTDGLVQIERLKVVMARQQLDQAKKEHAATTKAQVRADFSERQVKVLQQECKRLEERMTALERQLSPLQERRDLIARQYQEKLDQLEDCKRGMKSSNLRQKGAALPRFFHQIILDFRQVRRGKRVYGEWVGTRFRLNLDERRNFFGEIYLPRPNPNLPEAGIIEAQVMTYVRGAAEEYNSGTTAGRPR